jgi:hypothetical protein
MFQVSRPETKQTMVQKWNNLFQEKNIITKALKTTNQYKLAYL